MDKTSSQLVTTYAPPLPFPPFIFISPSLPFNRVYRLTTFLHFVTNTTYNPFLKSSNMMTCHHFVVISFPAQGHITPNLQLSNRLLRLGVRITFMTSQHARLAGTQLPTGLDLIEYNDGYDGSFAQDDGTKQKLAKMKESSSDALRQVVSSAALEGCPVTCIVYSLLLPWVAKVARELSVPSALIWIQPATVFDLYYYYFHDFDSLMHDLELKKQESSDDYVALDLPGLPMKFTIRELPSFFMPNSNNSLALALFHEHIAELDVESRSARVLVNTFDSLEPEALKAVSNLKLTAIGPLIPSAFLDGEDPSDTGFGGGLFRSTSSSYVEWLDSKPNASVVYVSFGSIAVLSKDQMEEIGRALLELNKPFLWIIRGYEKKHDKVPEVKNQLISCIEELEQLGLIVPWCSQLQVLSHPALSCFFTHCGWNSTLESLISGVPIVGFPQWSDQLTNGKLVEDYWKTGVRVSPNNDGLVERDEIKRCLELVMGDAKMRQNAEKWKKLAVEAVKVGGSSDKNLKDFVNEICSG